MITDHQTESDPPSRERSRTKAAQLSRYSDDGSQISMEDVQETEIVEEVHDINQQVQHLVDNKSAKLQHQQLHQLFDNAEQLIQSAIETIQKQVGLD